MTNSSFGALVRAYRTRAGLTQQQVANSLEVDFTYISKIEGDKAPPPAREKIALAAVVLRLTAEERDGLFLAAEKLPGELESWMMANPDALKLYSQLSRYPVKQQKQLLRDLLKQVERP